MPNPYVNFNGITCELWAGDAAFFLTARAVAETQAKIEFWRGTTQVEFNGLFKIESHGALPRFKAGTISIYYDDEDDCPVDARVFDGIFDYSVGTFHGSVIEKKLTQNGVKVIKTEGLFNFSNLDDPYNTVCSIVPSVHPMQYSVTFEQGTLETNSILAERFTGTIDAQGFPEFGDRAIYYYDGHNTPLHHVVIKRKQNLELGRVDYQSNLISSTDNISFEGHELSRECEGTEITFQGVFKRSFTYVDNSRGLVVAEGKFRSKSYDPRDIGILQGTVTLRRRQGGSASSSACIDYYQWDQDTFHPSIQHKLLFNPSLPRDTSECDDVEPGVYINAFPMLDNPSVYTLSVSVGICDLESDELIKGIMYQLPSMTYDQFKQPDQLKRAIIHSECMKYTLYDSSISSCGHWAEFSNVRYEGERWLATIIFSNQPGTAFDIACVGEKVLSIKKTSTGFGPSGWTADYVGNSYALNAQHFSSAKRRVVMQANDEQLIQIKAIQDAWKEYRVVTLNRDDAQETPVLLTTLAKQYYQNYSLERARNTGKRSDAREERIQRAFVEIEKAEDIERKEIVAFCDKRFVSIQNRMTEARKVLNSRERILRELQEESVLAKEESENVNYFQYETAEDLIDKESKQRSKREVDMSRKFDRFHAIFLEELNYIRESEEKRQASEQRRAETILRKRSVIQNFIDRRSFNRTADLGMQVTSEQCVSIPEELLTLQFEEDELWQDMLPLKAFNKVIDNITLRPGDFDIDWFNATLKLCVYRILNRCHQRLSLETSRTILVFLKSLNFAMGYISQSLQNELALMQMEILGAISRDAEIMHQFDIQDLTNYCRCLRHLRYESLEQLFKTQQINPIFSIIKQRINENLEQGYLNLFQIIKASYYLTRALKLPTPIFSPNEIAIWLNKIIDSSASTDDALKSAGMLRSVLLILPVLDGKSYELCANIDVVQLMNRFFYYKKGLGQQGNKVLRCGDILAAINGLIERKVIKQGQYHQIKDFVFLLLKEEYENILRNQQFSNYTIFTWLTNTNAFLTTNLFVDSYERCKLAHCINQLVGIWLNNQSKLDNYRIVDCFNAILHSYLFIARNQLTVDAQLNMSITQLLAAMKNAFSSRCLFMHKYINVDESVLVLLRNILEVVEFDGDVEEVSIGQDNLLRSVVNGIIDAYFRELETNSFLCQRLETFVKILELLAEYKKSGYFASGELRGLNRLNNLWKILEDGILKLDDLSRLQSALACLDLKLPLRLSKTSHKLHLSQCHSATFGERASGARYFKRPEQYSPEEGERSTFRRLPF